ncbi:MAG: prolyl oligopeptidase family serine peptidase [Candidatus Obscuribacterales bacterium]
MPTISSALAIPKVSSQTIRRLATKNLSWQHPASRSLCHDDPPFLIMHGDHDNVVPIKQSSDFYEVLKAAKVKVVYHVVKNGGHNFFSPENLQIVENWLKLNLRK